MEHNTVERKKEFIELCHQIIHREGINDLLNWLCESDFFTAPASTKYHGDYEGGLCEHSLNVYKCLKKLVNEYQSLKISDETIAIAALFHDICKVKYYKRDTKNVKDEATGSWIKKPIYIKSEECPLGDHADKSIILLQMFMKLTFDEIYGIRAHMGGYDNAARGGSPVIANIFGSNKFAVLVHLADMEATYLMEERCTTTTL